MKTNVSDRLRRLLKLVSNPARYFLINSISPTLDYTEFMTEIKRELESIAGNAVIRIYLDYGELLRIKYGRFGLDTDATAANRQAILAVINTESDILSYWLGTVVAANGVRSHYISDTYTGHDNQASADFWKIHDIFYPDILEIQVNLGQGGDVLDIFLNAELIPRVLD